MLIYLDPGHGGTDPGAVDPIDLKNGDKIQSKEADINLKIGLLVQKKLGLAGYTAKMTRDTNIFVSLDKRANKANQDKADLFVSIHGNAAANPEASGFEIFCLSFGGAGEKLARKIHFFMGQIQGLKDRGVKEKNLAVLRRTDMPAVLVEIGFLTNSQDERLLNSPLFQDQASTAIAKGVLAHWYGLTGKGSGE